MKTHAFLTGFYHGIEDFGNLMNLQFNSLLLFLVYISSVAFTSLIAKVIKKNFLKLRPEKIDTYWTELDLKKKKLEEYYRQFED